MSDPDRYHFKDHPRTCAPDDYWGQVKRTVNGRPVSRDQIELIVSAIRSGLDLAMEDVLLDLGCGNGALSDLVFEHCAGGVGVDFSEYLISVAKRDFEVPPARVYVLGDAVDFLRGAEDTRRFTKAMCYGAFMFLEEESARDFLALLRRRFPNVKRLFLGNLPDKARMSCYFRPEDYTPGIESDPTSPLGVWRTEEELKALARVAGWEAHISRMPAHFYASAYRFDAILVSAEAA